MKMYVIMGGNEVKAKFTSREEARQWVFKNDKFGDYIMYPMLVDDMGNMMPTDW